MTDLVKTESPIKPVPVTCDNVRLVSDEEIRQFGASFACNLARAGIAPADRWAAYHELCRLEGAGFDIPADIVEAFSNPA